MTAEQIAWKWVIRIGVGFHPDTRGEDYAPPLSADEVAEYDADMDALFAFGGDPYAAAVAAMEESQNLMMEVGLDPAP